MKFRGCHYFIKRDDLINPDFSGNKARKFTHYLTHDYPHIKRIVSYGSNQSNAMYSLSVLAKMRGWRFEYFVDHIPNYLKENPHGNYLCGLTNGVIFHESKWDDTQIIPHDTLLIHEGGRQIEAKVGVKLLAEEIEEWRVGHGLDDLSILLPSGTGTTALYLQKYSPSKVYTTPCVGDSTYLRSQWSALEADSTLHPTILETAKKYHFGKLYKEHYELWMGLKRETGIEFDLLYDPIGWRAIEEQKPPTPLLYIHQGGLLGNMSMIPRYQRKYGN